MAWRVHTLGGHGRLAGQATIPAPGYDLHGCAQTCHRSGPQVFWVQLRDLGRQGSVQQGIKPLHSVQETSILVRFKIKRQIFNVRLSSAQQRQRTVDLPGSQSRSTRWTVDWQGQPFRGFCAIIVAKTQSNQIWYHALSSLFTFRYGTESSMPVWWPNDVFEWTALKNLSHRYDGQLGDSYSNCLRLAIVQGYEFYNKVTQFKFCKLSRQRIKHHNSSTELPWSPDHPDQLLSGIPKFNMNFVKGGQCHQDLLIYWTQWSIDLDDLLKMIDWTLVL